MELDLNLADSWVDLETTRFLIVKGAWRFRFAITRGELRLDLKELISPISRRNFRAELPLSERVKRNISNERKEVESAQSGIELSSASAKLGIKSKTTASASESKGQTIADEYEINRVILQEKGDEFSPKWTIQAQVGEDVLKGGFRARLADFEIVGVPCELGVNFCISFDSVKILEVDSPEFHSKSTKRQRVLQQMMRKHVREASQSGISEVKVHYGSNEQDQTPE